jgi:hypothetical protein
MRFLLESVVNVGGAYRQGVDLVPGVRTDEQWNEISTVEPSIGSSVIQAAVRLMSGGTVLLTLLWRSTPAVDLGVTASTNRGAACR